VWDINNKKCLQTLQVNSGVKKLEKAQDDNLIISIDEDKLIKYWDLREKKCIDEIALDVDVDGLRTFKYYNNLVFVSTIKNYLEYIVIYDILQRKEICKIAFDTHCHDIQVIPEINQLLLSGFNTKCYSLSSFILEKEIPPGII